ncbi:MAG: tetratricopeptide repeat protein [Promethearchaeati archaeon]
MTEFYQENKKIILWIKEGEFDKATNLARELLQKAKNNGNKISIAHQYKIFGNVYSRVGNFQTAHEYYNKALDIFKELKNSKGISDIYGCIAVNFQAEFQNLKMKRWLEKSKEKLESAQKYHLIEIEIKEQRIEFFKEKGVNNLKIEKKNLALAYSNIANIFREKGELDKALRYQKKALDIFENMNDIHGICRSLLNIGNIYGNKNEHQKALDYQFRALKKAKKNNFKPLSVKILFNIASTYQYSLEYKKALTYYLKCFASFYLIIKNIKTETLRKKYSNSFNLLPFIINSIQLLRKPSSNSDRYKSPTDKGTVEYYASKDNIPEIRNILSNISQEILVISDAKELFDFKIENILIIINQIQKNNIDLNLKKILYKQIIVILVTGLEIYFRERLIEIAKQNNNINLKKLYNKFIPSLIRETKVKKIKNHALKKDLSEIEVFFNKNFINFQDLKEIFKVYLCVLNLDLNKIIPNQYKRILNRLLHLRQQVVHLNIKLEDKEYSENIINLINIINKIINHVHESKQIDPKEIVLNKIGILKIIEIGSKNSKKIFDEKIKNIEMLLKYVSLNNKYKINYRFKVIIYQQIIVMTVSAFEIYGIRRFLELEQSLKNKENLIDYDGVLKRFVSQKERIIKKSEESGKSIFKILIEERKINFQDWNQFKRSYNIAYNIIVGNIYEKTHIFEEMQNFFKWRKIVIHSKIDSPVLNFASSPPEEPIYLNKKILEKNIIYFKDVVNTIHTFSENLLEN